MPLRNEIQIRDPFILPIAETKTYYLFGTTGPNCWTGPQTGFDFYRSPDLEHWEGPFPAFRPAPDFWADQNFWAPEVHPYRGAFYMFASFKAEGVQRGTQILKADSVEGPYLPHSDGPVTPRDWDCLDGTLFIDDEGQPWMVFCHEWAQIGDGTVCAVRLSPELDRAVGEPILLFHASEAPWVIDLNEMWPETHGFCTDGPFMHRAADGTLFMLWASMGKKGYGQALARSESGKITGPWIQNAEPLFGDDGGHGMIFRTFEGELRLSLHLPNDTPNERPHFLPLRETGNNLELI